MSVRIVQSPGILKGTPALHADFPPAIKASFTRAAEDDVEVLRRRLQRMRDAHELADRHRIQLEDELFLVQRELAILRRGVAA